MISTKNVPNASGMSKTILPGERTLRINSITLDKMPYDEESYHLNLHCETEPIEGLDGFWIDKDNQSKGKYKGQIGRIHANYWPYKDGQTKSGIVIKRDRSILQFVKNLANELGFEQWFEEQDNKFNTIEDFVNHLNKTKPFKDVWFKAIVGGKGYDKGGYVNYDLFFPNFTKSGKPIACLTDCEMASEAPLIAYEPEIHLKKSTSSSNQSVPSFGTPVSQNVASDFDLS